MARLPQLINALAVVDGRRIGTIEHVSRVLRKEGLLVSGQRGAGAPAMNFADAANLLIAVNAADALVDAPEATRLMRSLRPAGEVNDQIPYPLPDIELQENFGDALGVVIMGAPQIVDLIEAFIDERYGSPYSSRDRAAFCRQIRLGMGPVVFKIVLARTFARLSIESVDAHPKVEWQRRYYLPSEMLSNVARAFQGDRKVSVEVGLPTIIALHECISGKPMPTIHADNNSGGE